ncbi:MULTISPECIES: nitrile hydratase accessory protein [unclassified Paenibacillus]|nr:MULTISPECIES: nitrile hydratase accessory protein [unclassified Paenibacillus]
MSEQSKALISSIQESMQLPRDNGELVFRTPWEGRAFAIAVLMTEKGVYPWKEFNGKFVEEIGGADRNNPERDGVSDYYQLWIQALEKMLLGNRVLTEEQLQTRTDEFATGERHHIC